VKKRDLIFIAVGIISGIVIFWLFFNNNGNRVSKKDTTKNNTTKERKVLYWKAPMNPTEIYDKPGKSRMGMDLVPVYEDETGSEGLVSIDGTLQQNMNLKTEVIESKTLKTSVVTNGVLRTDERKEFIVNTKAGGWVEKLYVNYTGQKVKKGEKLIDIYSPKLVAAQQEFLTAVSYGENVINSLNKSISKSGRDLIENSIQKLRLLDVRKKEIDELKRTKKVKKFMTLYAPFNGTVIHKNVIEGQKINPGTPLFKIADLKNLWLIADIYEYELSKIKLGAEAEIKFNFFPGKIFNSRITFIYPTLDAKTRTVKVRFDIPNYNNELKPSMFATIDISGKDLSNHPLIPEQAVIRSGQKNIVIIALGNGKFKSVEVKLGENAKGYFQVLEGLDEGTRIVISSQFLIDSESNLKAALNQFRPFNKDTAKKKMNMDAETAKISKMKKNKSFTDKTTTIKESIIRKGIIDVASIDKNKDGKLFQDIMDWNVISDKPGICPECGMTLREFTIKQVKENLKKHGFKFK